MDLANEMQSAMPINIPGVTDIDLDDYAGLVEFIAEASSTGTDVLKYIYNTSFLLLKSNYNKHSLHFGIIAE